MSSNPEFAVDLFPPTLQEQIACVRREIAMRHRVYPGLVDKGRMKPEAAEREIECMQAALNTLQELAERRGVRYG